MIERIVFLLELAEEGMVVVVDARNQTSPIEPRAPIISALRVRKVQPGLQKVILEFGLRILGSSDLAGLPRALLFTGHNPKARCDSERRYYHSSPHNRVFAQRWLYVTSQIEARFGCVLGFLRLRKFASQWEQLGRCCITELVGLRFVGAPAGRVRFS
jgi:hypothetical protein